MRQPATRSYLYTVRLWPEDLGDGAWEWRGVVKLVATGEEHSFREWATLGLLMVQMAGEPGERIEQESISSPTA